VPVRPRETIRPSELRLDIFRSPESVAGLLRNQHPMIEGSERERLRRGTRFPFPADSVERSEVANRRSFRSAVDVALALFFDPTGVEHLSQLRVDVSGLEDTLVNGFR
jgi:hypothetical protein